MVIDYIKNIFDFKRYLLLEFKGIQQFKLIFEFQFDVFIKIF